MAKKEKRVDVPNQGHKHLFGTTEKSDFILNMDFDGAHRMCSRFLMLAIAIVTLVLIPAYYTQTVEMYTEDNVPHFLSDNFIFYAASMVMLTGGVGYLVFNVSRQKGLVDIKGNRLLVLPLIVMLFTLISSLAAVSIHDSILGYIGRHDGFLMTFGCFGLFAVAAALGKAGDKKKLGDVIVGAGVLQSLVGILEAIPATAGAFCNYFDKLFLRLGTEVQADGEFYVSPEENLLSPGIYTDGKVASGYLTSPHALAALIAVAFAIALAGAAFDDNKKRRICYIIAAPVMAAAACLSEVWSGVVCICAAALIVTVIAVIKAAKGGKGALAVLLPVVLSGVIAGALFGSGKASFKDEAIIFTDSFANNRATGNYTRYDYMHGVTDKETDTRDIYNYLFGDAENVISAKPVLGIGPDNAPYYINDYSLSLDRTYNEFMDTAMQKGLLTLIAYAAFLVVTIVKGIKLVAAFIKGKGDWMSAAALAAVLTYLAQAWFNTTWFSATYLFFIAAGLCWDISVKGKESK
ncbi:MAG: hypothetical protein J6I46_04525 [Ruminococcus sp.]|nr:hypothetical protein [Ruminococcus sp.]